MKYFFTFLFAFSALITFAQKKQTITYYDINSKEIKTPTDTLYSKIVTDNGNNKYYIVEKYYNGKIKFEATMKGIEPNLYYVGPIVSYNKNGGKQFSLNYSKEGLIGDSYFYYPNGNLHEHRIYLKREKDNKHGLQNYKLIQIIDSLGNAFLDGKGNGRFSATLKNGDSKSGEYLNGFKTGLWKSYNAELNEHYEDEYLKNKFIKGRTIFSDGSILNYNDLETSPTFNGGKENFNKFLINNSKYPINLTKKDKAHGRVFIYFIVEKSGKLTDLKISSGFSKEYNQEALRIMKLSPNWIPGTERGIPVSVSYSIPIYFKLP